MRLAFAISAADLLLNTGAGSYIRRNPQESRRLHSARIIPRWVGHSQLLRRTHRLWNCAIADHDSYLLADYSDIHHLALGDHRIDCRRPGRARTTDALKTTSIDRVIQTPSYLGIGNA